jgi:hypothetical protein
MAQTEEEALRDEVERTFTQVVLTAEVLEAAERHLGPSNWDYAGAAQRASAALEDRELTIDEMHTIIENMRGDLRSALEPLNRYRQDANATRATIMLGFMLNGCVNRITKIVESSGDGT